MLPYGWLIVFSISVSTFFLINSSWSSFFFSFLSSKKKLSESDKKDFWY